MADTAVGIKVYADFDHLPLSADTWDGLLRAGSTDVPFLTFQWQRAWWEAFGGDRLLIVIAERGGKPYAVAPLFVLEDMLFLVGSGGSDYLDFIGDLDEPTLAAMLDAARRELPEFEGVKLFHLPLESKTTSLLPGVAKSLDLELFEEGRTPAPYLDLTDAQRVSQAVERRKLRKEESRMRRAGPLLVHRAQTGDLDPWLETFFAQHASRWNPVGEDGFERGDARAFCRAVVHDGHRAGWLQLTMLEWCGRPVAFDISLIRNRRYLAYLVSRDVAIRAYSPGKILERHVIKEAVDGAATCFDLGLGDEEYKLHHASGVNEVVDWSLYP